MVSVGLSPAIPTTMSPAPAPGVIAENVIRGLQLAARRAATAAGLSLFGRSRSGDLATAISKSIHTLRSSVEFRRARNANFRFLRAFRKSTRLDAVAAATEQFRAAPLVVVFDFGYSEVCRQMAARGMISNKMALERTLQGPMLKRNRPLRWCRPPC